MKFSIGIPTLNRADLLVECCKPLESLPYPVMIVDNGRQRINLPPRFDVYQEPKNLGVAASWNRIMAKAFYQHKSDYCILLNDDCVWNLTPELLESVVNNAGDDVGVITSGYYWSIIIIPRSTFEAVGYFDEAFFPAYFEDNDYAYRLKLAGLKHVIDSRLDPVVQRNSQTTAKNPRISRFDRNKAYYAEKWGGLPAHDGKPATEAYIHPFNVAPVKQTPKLLIYSDSPYSNTGFATVTRNLVKHLHSDYNITVLGINHTGHYWDKDIPCRVVPALVVEDMTAQQPDFYGIKRLQELLEREAFDIVLTINDMNLIEVVLPALVSARCRWNNGCKLIAYWPVDHPQYPEHKAIQVMFDKNVFYTEYGARVGAYQNQPFDIIPHGFDDEAANVPLKPFCRAFHFPNIPLDAPLFISVNRNQPRKNIPQLMTAFSILKKQDEFKNAVLYLHMSEDDIGGSLREMARAHRLIVGKDVYWPIDTVDRQTLLEIYKAADVFVTTTFGEGWGLTITEALSAGLPVVAPANTCIPEVVGKANQRYLYPCDKIVNSGKDDQFRLREIGKFGEIAIKMMQAYRERMDYSADTSHLISWREVANRFKKVFA